MRAARGTADTWMKEGGVDRALRYEVEVMGWATDDIEGVYERVTPAMRKHRPGQLRERWVRARRGTRWAPLRKRS
ncbi:hypothetical protein [Streptomyces sp. MAR4 CNX-425]|uniref:hypothetical protein n=1 Tax=Streptomyces sp. MAR4 CNX-425 TaxID=3406343 RepID=UPI003B50D378